ncbi:MAG: hypothetical protein DMF62_12285, partial [Acidobacteria bacterium]
MSAPILAGRLDGSEAIPTEVVSSSRPQSGKIEMPRVQIPAVVLQETVSDAASSAVVTIEPAQPLEVAALDNVSTNGEHFESENTWSIPATLRDIETLKAADAARPIDGRSLTENKVVQVSATLPVSKVVISSFVKAFSSPFHSLVAEVRSFVSPKDAGTEDRRVRPLSEKADESVAAVPEKTASTSVLAPIAQFFPPMHSTVSSGEASTSAISESLVSAIAPKGVEIKTVTPAIAR